MSLNYNLILITEFKTYKLHVTLLKFWAYLKVTLNSHYFLIYELWNFAKIFSFIAFLQPFSSFLCCYTEHYDLQKAVSKWRPHPINYKQPSFENILRFYPLRQNLWSRKSAKEWFLNKRYCTWPQRCFPKITSLSKYLLKIFTSTKNLWNNSSKVRFQVFQDIVECWSMKTLYRKGTLVTKIYFFT